MDFKVLSFYLFHSKSLYFHLHQPTSQSRNGPKTISI